MTKTKRLLATGLLLFSCLAGGLISILLTSHYYEVRQGAGNLQSACNLNEAFNCSSVAASPFAEILPGVPVASVGASFFLSLFVVVCFSFFVFWRQETQRLILVLSLFGLAFSARMLFIMIFSLETYCLWCLCLDVLGVLCFGCALTLQNRQELTRKPHFKKLFFLLGLFGFVLILATWGLQRPEPQGFSEDDIRKAAENILQSPAVEIRDLGTGLSLGPAQAPITLVEFSDFQCPFCRMGAQVLSSVVAHYKNKIRIVFKNYPLDRSCARWMGEQQMHPHACEAAKAAVCANQQNRFKEIYEGLFDNQAAFARGGSPQIKQISQKAGVDLQEWEKCMQSEEASALVLKDIDEGQRLDLNSTPTFYLNGHQIKRVYPVPVWIKVIDQLLEKRN